MYARTHGVATSPHLAQGTTNTNRSVEERCAPKHRDRQCSNPTKSGLMEGRMAVARVLRVGGLAGCGKCGTLVRGGRRTRGPVGRQMGFLVQVCFLSFDARFFPHLQRPDRVVGRSLVERTARPHPPTTAQSLQPKSALLHQQEDAPRSSTAAVSHTRSSFLHVSASTSLSPPCPTARIPCPDRAHCDPVPRCALRLVARRASGCRSKVQRRPE